MKLKLNCNFLISIATMMILLSCGDSGGDSPNSDSNGRLEASPNQVDLYVGDSTEVLITGGTPPYTVESNNSSTAVGSIIDYDTLTISANAESTAQIVVSDAAGNSTAINVTVELGACLEVGASIGMIGFQARTVYLRNRTNGETLVEFILLERGACQVKEDEDGGEPEVVACWNDATWEGDELISFEVTIGEDSYFYPEDGC